jgi:hypothetical protein
MFHMSIPQVWVSTTTPTIQFDNNNPGAHWELVGRIDTTLESDIRKHIQKMQGTRNTAPRAAEFYVSGDPASPWVQGDTRAPFWIAIDPYGTMRPQIHGAKPTYLVSNDRATVTPLGRRPPEPHPGAMVKPIMVPIRLKRTSAGFLTKWTGI